MHTILLMSLYYSTSAPACFGPHCYVIRQNTVVQNGCLMFSACNRSAENSSLYIMCVEDRVVHWS